MTTAVSYDYCARNLLEERYHYMYTPFAGAAFLRAYFDQRAGAIAALDGSAEAAAGELDLAWIASIAPGTMTGPVPAVAGPVRTAPLLAALVGARLRGGAAEARDWEELLMRKFEVSKRVYEAYDDRLRGSGAATPRAPYVLLAALFALRHHQDGDVRALNTLLKLDDLILSAGAASLNDGERRIAAWALRHERRAIQAMAGEHAIRVD